MPYLSEKKGVLIPRDYKATTRISEEDRAEVVRLRKENPSYWSQRKLAAKFGVSRRLIQFILDPVKAEKAKQQFAERQKTGRYYDREKHNAHMRKHRAYKRQLAEEGKLLDVRKDKLS